MSRAGRMGLVETQGAELESRLAGVEARDCAPRGRHDVLTAMIKAETNVCATVRGLFRCRRE